MAKLKRDLNLFFATMSGVGIILGAGIYVLIGEATGIAGNAVWISFLLSAVLAGLTGLSYAELSSMFTRDEGEYQYANNAFGRRIAFLIGVMIIFAGVTSAAAVGLGFGGYLTSLTGIGTGVSMALAAVLLFSFISFYGIRESAWLNVVFTFIEAGGLFLIIALAWNRIGSVNYFEMPNGLGSVFQASALIFFAFVGFEAIVKLSEETINPTKTIPKALLWSIAISTVIYILVAIAAVSVLPWEQLGASSAPLADVAAAVLGSKAFILLSIIALFSTGNTILIILVTTSRMLYGVGANIPSLHLLRHVHKRRRTPWIAVGITCLLSLLFVLMGDIKLVASASNFTVFVTFMVVNLSLIWLRYLQPTTKRPFKVPWTIGKFPVLPALGAFVSIFMLGFLDIIALLGGIGLLLIGNILFYFFCTRYAKKNICHFCK